MGDARAHHSRYNAAIRDGRGGRSRTRSTKRFERRLQQWIADCAPDIINGESSSPCLPWQGLTNHYVDELLLEYHWSIIFTYAFQPHINASGYRLTDVDPNLIILDGNQPMASECAVPCRP